MYVYHSKTVVRPFFSDTDENELNIIAFCLVLVYFYNEVLVYK
jgi:hypothetical protein